METVIENNKAKKALVAYGTFQDMFGGLLKLKFYRKGTLHIIEENYRGIENTWEAEGESWMTESEHFMYPFLDNREILGEYLGTMICNHETILEKS